jgi:hypothetical protein
MENINLSQEKETISGLLAKTAREAHVPLPVNSRSLRQPSRLHTALCPTSTLACSFPPSLAVPDPSVPTLPLWCPLLACSDLARAGFPRNPSPLSGLTSPKASLTILCEKHHLSLSSYASSLALPSFLSSPFQSSGSVLRTSCACKSPCSFY